MKKNEKLVWVTIGALLAGMAGEWFLSGTYDSHSQVRNIFVLIQLIIGIGIILYPFIKRAK